ncbi:GntR family transcriptional regulator [Ensifer adhaerens]|uniref:GntR family transcriptional regulator n=1 Tax=Ensifer adhaerens TaxID=106592 RepID=UPI003CFE93B8
MLQELRFRICTTDPDTPMMLHEGKLAQEFGVSRTPIRQVLQRLSFEHLLETRSGVGTVVSTLDPTQRNLHFSMLSDMLTLCTRCCAPNFAMPARIQIATIGELAANPGDTGVESYFAIRARFLELVSGLVLDPIAAEAHAALHWRVIRWRMQAARKDVEAAFSTLRATVLAASKAQTPAELFSYLAAETE